MHLREKQLQHKLDAQAEALNNKIQEMAALQDKMSSDILEMQMNIADLENVKVKSTYY